MINEQLVMNNEYWKMLS